MNRILHAVCMKRRAPGRQGFPIFLPRQPRSYSQKRAIEAMPTIRAIAHAFPDHYYPQEAMLEALREHWAKGHSNLDRLERIHHSVGVNGRHLALPMEEYEGLDGFAGKNSAWIRCALD